MGLYPQTEDRLCSGDEREGRGHQQREEHGRERGRGRGFVVLVLILGGDSADGVGAVVGLGWGVEI